MVSERLSTNRSSFLQSKNDRPELQSQILDDLAKRKAIIVKQTSFKECIPLYFLVAFIRKSLHECNWNFTR